MISFKISDSLGMANMITNTAQKMPVPTDSLTMKSESVLLRAAMSADELFPKAATASDTSSIFSSDLAAEFAVRTLC